MEPLSLDALIIDPLNMFVSMFVSRIIPTFIGAFIGVRFLLALTRKDWQ